MAIDIRLVKSTPLSPANVLEVKLPISSPPALNITISILVPSRSQFRYLAALLAVFQVLRYASTVMQRLKDTWPPQYTPQATPQKTRGIVGEINSFNFFAHTHRFLVSSQCYVIARSSSLEDTTKVHAAVALQETQGEMISSDAIVSKNSNSWLLARFLLLALRHGPVNGGTVSGHLFA